MWKALIVSIALSAATQAVASERSVTIADERAEQRCAETVIADLPGRFLPDERTQVLSVRRRAAGPRDIACWYEAVIWDAQRPFPAGAIAHVWSEIGPGEIFADAHWRDSGWHGSLNVRVVRLASFRADSVLATSVSTRRGRTITRTQLIAFNQVTGFSERVLNVAAYGEFETRIDGDNIVIELAAPISNCAACGRARRISLHYNRDVGALELNDTTSEAVAIYGSMTALAGSV